MKRSWRNVWYLIRVMAITDFKIKYNNSVLGYFWSLLRPLLMFGVMMIVFTKIMRFGANDPFYPLKMLLGIIIWNFLTEVTLNGMEQTIAKMEIMKKVYFPRGVVVASASMTAGLTLFLNLIVFLVFFLIYGAKTHLAVVTFPLLLLELLVISLGLALGLSALYTKFRDLAHIWEVFLQVGFYITPIIVPYAFIEKLAAEYNFLLFCNPLARIVMGAHQAVIADSPSNFLTWQNHMFILTAAAACFAVGYAIFHRMNPDFAESR